MKDRHIVWFFVTFMVINSINNLQTDIENGSIEHTENEANNKTLEITTTVREETEITTEPKQGQKGALDLIKNYSISTTINHNSGAEEWQKTNGISLDTSRHNMATADAQVLVTTHEISPVTTEGDRSGQISSIHLDSVSTEPASAFPLHDDPLIQDDDVVHKQPNDVTLPSQDPNITSEIELHYTTNKRATTSLQNFKNEPVTTDVNAIKTQDLCSQYGGCELASGPLWYCHCDELCEEYNDCCMDYNFNITNGQTDTTYSCVEITNKAPVNVGMQTIANCPLSFNDQTIVTKCSIDHINTTGPPVLGKSGPSRIFRNKYCALCHDASYFDMDVVFSDVHSLYSYDEASKMAHDEYQRYLFNTCTYRLVIPESAHVRYCFKEFKQSNNPLCHKYSNPILNELELYRNGYCMDNINDVEFLCLFKIMDGLTDYKVDFTFEKLSILFSFRETELASNHLECLEWNEKVDRACAGLPKYTNASIDLDYSIKMPENTTTTEITQAVLLSAFTKYADGYTEVQFPLDLWVDKDASLLNLKGKVKVLKTIFSHQMLDLKRRINNQAVSITDSVDSSRRFESNKASENSTSGSFEFIRITNPFLSRVPLHDIFASFGIEIHDFKLTKFCDDVKIITNRDDANILQIGSITCKSLALKHGVAPVLGIITLTLFAVSSFALVVMIAFNRRYDYHREIACSNVENIGVFLLLSNVSFVLGNFVSKINLWVCTVVSVVSHYFWLTSFSFTSVAVFHVAKSLLELKANPMRNEEYKRKRRRSVTIIGLLVPLLVVSPAVVVDQVGPPYYSPGYSNTDICFPIRFPGNMIFFTGPVMAMITLNTLGLIVVIWKVHMATLSRRNMRVSSSFSDAKVFLRVMSLTGCFWITGIMASYFRTEWLEYVFTLVCGLQGVFIAIANLTTRRFSCCTMYT